MPSNRHPLIVFISRYCQFRGWDTVTQLATGVPGIYISFFDWYCDQYAVSRVTIRNYWQSLCRMYRLQTGSGMPKATLHEIGEVSFKICTGQLFIYLHNLLLGNLGKGQSNQGSSTLGNAQRKACHKCGRFLGHAVVPMANWWLSVYYRTYESSVSLIRTYCRIHWI